MNPLKSTNWLCENIGKVKILDATWHMPNSNRNAFKEYQDNHIKSSIFFDLDKNSNQKISLPHMLPELQEWEKIVSELGVKNNDHIIIYDNSDVLSASRCWFTFLYFGHDMNLVSVLDGGLKKWKLENKKTSNYLKTLNKTNYLVVENKDLVKNKFQIHENIKTNYFQLIDARGKKRFDGIDAEPRPNLKSGHIQNSLNLPFSECVNKSDHTFKTKEELLKIFQDLKISNEKNQVFTCGSGVTACILAMANKIINDKDPVIYDGSWSEYGLK